MYGKCVVKKRTYNERCAVKKRTYNEITQKKLKTGRVYFSQIVDGLGFADRTSLPFFFGRAAETHRLWGIATGFPPFPNP
jgi:hypothetical protein